MKTALDNPQRRQLLLAMAAGGGATLLGAFAWAHSASAGNSNGFTQPGKVSITVFDDQGNRVGTQEMAKVIKTDAQWKKQLSSASYRITRQAGTERAFSGNYSKRDEPGIFHCICCDTALYDGDTEFHSGTGWPSFWQPIAATNVSEHTDSSFGMQRTEVRCARCDAHLGHKFHDGPKPTGLRYCMNAVAMTFVPNTSA